MKKHAFAGYIFTTLLGMLLIVSDAVAQPNNQRQEQTLPRSNCALDIQFDPIAGNKITRHELSCLPSGRHIGAVLDVWFNQVINQQISGGGIAFFDPVRLSSHGRSWQQTRFHLNGIEITDPARPGEPLFELPHRAWDTLTYHSLWTDRPGINLSFNAETPHKWQVTGAIGKTINGRTWIPSGLMDREPAAEHGALLERRQLLPVQEAFVERTWQLGQKNKLRLISSFAKHEHRYPTLRSNNGRNEVDQAERSTIALRHRFDNGRTLVSTTLVSQNGSRSHEGAQYRWEQPLTLDISSQSWAAHLQWARPKANLSFFVGITNRNDDERARNKTPSLRDIESEWMYLARPRHAENVQRRRLDTGANWEWKGWKLGIRGAHSRINLDIQSQKLQGISYLRGPARGQSLAHSVKLSSSGAMQALWLLETRFDVKRELRFKDVKLQVETSLDHSGAGSLHGPTLGYWSPAVGALMSTPCASGECFALIRHEPIALTREVSEFLSPGNESTTHAWNDDGDLVPEADEIGRLLARHGGVFHSTNENLKRPNESHFVFGIKTPRLGPFRAIVSGIGRWLFNRYSVRLADPSIYSPIETRTADGELVTAYAKDVSQAKEETYLLVNDVDVSRYLGVEIQLYSEAKSNWFFNLSASGYHSISSAPFGNFADRNDPGIIDELSANPNARLNMYGRPDNDRAYGVTLLVGGNLTHNLSLATSTRYVDGQPFARIDVVDTLPQGPVAIMTTQRGTPGPRYTFHMTTDLRLSYDWKTNSKNTLSFVLDIFNLLGSGTEIAEDPRAGGTGFRRALEMIPDRAVFLTIGWRGLF